MWQEQVLLEQKGRMNVRGYDESFWEEVTPKAETQSNDF